VQNLQKKHALLEADVSSHAERIDSIRAQAETFIERGHFDADNIRAKRVTTPLTAFASFLCLFL
jgi:spectrin alpha